MEIVHTPVLVEETLALLGPRKDGELMADGTIGEGGHSEAFLRSFPETRIVGIDADKTILETAKKRLAEFGNRIEFYAGWSQTFFAERRNTFDTILIDSGISVFHYARSGRGFSFSKDEPLDMRLDTGQGMSAADLIERLSEKDFADLLFNNAEERYSRRIARAVTEARTRGRIASAGALADIVARAVPPTYRRARLHPATKTFQALRMAVNGELIRLPTLLENATNALKVRGRLGFISFESLTDRTVKLFFKERYREGTVTMTTKRAVCASVEEIRQNPPSRSARLRVIEKKEKKGEKENI
ncbi:MAG: 16S rRNA (cytosine(1402)-N(4))-methyltransferase RsmH [Treponema sp.]|jgi:16S rRNA (cytosine1402-N4)-methyltransferase|nr:16S rRNA (cytosine(1402)-N(4))-methyltransferase RsmH [Treponema sp.]